MPGEVLACLYARIEVGGTVDDVRFVPRIWAAPAFAADKARRRVARHSPATLALGGPASGTPDSPQGPAPSALRSPHPSIASEGISPVSYPVEELQRFGYQQELRRALRFRDLLAHGLIFMVPIAPMAIFGAVFSASGGMVVTAYAIGVLALVFTAFSYSQMVRTERPALP